ncbi:MAG: hypothetical protein AAB576_03220, partial [Elusimicrobiota bacterium]
PTTMGGGAQTVVNFQSQAGGLPEAAFEDGYRYQMVARGEDLLNKRETTVTTRTFTVDRSTPTTTLSVPAEVSIFISTSNFTLSSGTHAEALIGGNVFSSVTAVEAQLQDLSGGAHVIPGGLAYWNPYTTPNWNAGATQSTATLHASSWTYSFLPADWVRGDAFPDGRQYELRVRARDKAGNQGTFPNTLTSVVRLTFDGAKPISGIVTPAAADDAIVNTLASITGTASDPLVNSSSSGVKAVSLIIQDVGGGIGCNTNFYWDAAANGGLGDWSPTVVFNPTAFNPGNGEWTWSSASMDLRLGVDCKYVIISSATDRAGNGQGTASQTMTSWKRLQFQPPPAVTAITAPTAIHYNDLKLFGGTANGNTVRVEVQLKRHDTGQCWGGTQAMGWVSCSGAVGASTGTRVVYPAVLAWNYPLTG